MNLKNQNGFTLVEILVAIGLLALILGVSMQIFTSSSKSLSHLEEQLFSVFENYAAAAGYKFAQERIEFALDMAYSQSNDENGMTQSVVGSGYIK